MNDQTNNDLSQGLHIDADWKAEARKEKERLTASSADSQAAEGGEAAGSAEAAAAAGQRGGRGQMPPADFQTLISTMVTQAMYAMGMVPDPQTGQRVAILDLARHHIDMLGVIQEKTKGNLTDEEEKLLAGALYELRMQYVELNQQAMQQQTSPGSGGAGESAGGANNPGGISL